VLWQEGTSQYWERGRPRPHSVRSTLQFPDAVTGSRFALKAGEGARVPSTSRLIPDQIDFLGEPYES